MTGNLPIRAVPGALALLALVAGCAPERPYSSPDFPFGARYASAPATLPVLLADEAWWERLGDPALTRLIGVALGGSPTLEAARARIAAAEAARDGVGSPWRIGTSTGIQLAGADGADPEVRAPLRLNLDWLFDPWGERRDRTRAASLRVDVADAQLDAARLALTNAVASAYVDLRYRQRALGLARSELAGRQETLALTRTLREADEATEIETTRAAARIAEIRSRLPALEAAVATARIRLAVLAGVAPGALPASVSDALAADRLQPRPDLPPRIGIPADLLRNRPDIRAAERTYAAAVAETGAAQAALYPSLSLAGALTLDLIGGGYDVFVGPSLALPDLPRAADRAAVRQRRAEALAAHAEWRGTVLTALGEVETALADYSAASSAVAAAEEALGLYRRTAQLTRRIFQTGEVTFGDLVDAEEAASQAELRLAELRLQQAQTFIDLYTRLGAGHAL